MLILCFKMRKNSIVYDSQVVIDVHCRHIGVAIIFGWIFFLKNYRFWLQFLGRLIKSSFCIEFQEKWSSALLQHFPAKNLTSANSLTLIHSLNRKWLVFATNVEPDHPAYPCSLTRLYTVFIMVSLKMIMDSSENGRWIIPFKKFSRLRVKKSVISRIFFTTIGI